MQRSKTEGARPVPAHADLGSVIETQAECYAIAEQCEERAATVHGARAREILLEVAGQWRRMGADLTAQTVSRPLRTLN